MEVLLDFDLYLIGCHISVFDDVTMYLIRERKSDFHGDKTLLTRVMKLNVNETKNKTLRWEWMFHPCFISIYSLKNKVMNYQGDWP